MKHFRAGPSDIHTNVSIVTNVFRRRKSRRGWKTKEMIQIGEAREDWLREGSVNFEPLLPAEVRVSHVLLAR